MRAFLILSSLCASLTIILARTIKRAQNDNQGQSRDCRYHSRSHDVRCEEFRSHNLLSPKSVLEPLDIVPSVSCGKLPVGVEFISIVNVMALREVIRKTSLFHDRAIEGPCGRMSEANAMSELVRSHLLPDEA